MSPDPPTPSGASLPPGMIGSYRQADSRAMSAAVLTKVAPAGSSRLLADVKALSRPNEKRDSALIRLEAALGREFADRLVSALSTEPKQ
jgi:hypothetical protein